MTTRTSVHRVLLAQREQARTSWVEIYGDDPLPKFASSLEWTQWVLQERRIAQDHFPTTSLAKAQPLAARRAVLDGGELAVASIAAPVAVGAAARPARSAVKSCVSKVGWCTAERLRMQEVQSADDSMGHQSTEAGEDTPPRLAAHLLRSQVNASMAVGMPHAEGARGWTVRAPPKT